MIRFKTQDELRAGLVSHPVLVKKPIGEFFETEITIINIMKMSGKIYDPGKTKDGKWKDQKRKPDNRFMVFSGNKYSVVTEEQLHDCFDEQ